MKDSAIINFPILKVTDQSGLETADTLAIEEPLEIRIAYGPEESRTVKNISVTMRTPGNDAELATGFLFTEGIIRLRSELASISHCFIACAENKKNVIQVELRENAIPNLPQTDRNFYTTSSCGVCGKGSIDAIRTVSSYNPDKKVNHTVNYAVLHQLPDRLREHQRVFDATGGLHASALFTPDGELLLVREDVGRHNALDKLIGAALELEWLPLDKMVLLLSGRASFELIQKAAMAGITIIAAVGAPSSLAVQLADEFGITLVGFLRQQRFNIYTAVHRITMNNYEDQN
jgi:FdhD protein